MSRAKSNRGRRFGKNRPRVFCCAVKPDESATADPAKSREQWWQWIALNGQDDFQQGNLKLSKMTHRIKVSFLSGAFRTIEFDTMHVNGAFVIFNMGEETVLTGVTRNMTFFEPVPPGPEKTSRQESRQGTFGARNPSCGA